MCLFKHNFIEGKDGLVFCKKCGKITKEATKKQEISKLEILKINYPINTKIILLSNQPNTDSDDFNDLIIGEVVGYDEITKSKQPVILYKNLNTGKVEITFSTILYYSETLKENLLKLTWEERFNIASLGRHILDKKYKNTRETEYLK